MSGKPNYKKKYRFGDTWYCECGAEYKLDGPVLAAQWLRELRQDCKHCGREHAIQNGTMRLSKEPPQHPTIDEPKPIKKTPSRR